MPAAHFLFAVRWLLCALVAGGWADCGHLQAAAASEPGIFRSVSQFNLLSWDTENGLPQNTVQAVAQTPDGHLWVGTKEGLARFNGVDFTVYTTRSTPELPDNSITALLVAPDGTLWIGTEGVGIVRLEGGVFSRYGKQEGMRRSRIRALRWSADGSLWIASGSGVDHFKDGRFVSYTRDNGLPKSNVRCLELDSSGAAWIGTSSGTRLIKDGVITQPESDRRRRSNTVRALFEDRTGGRWSASTSEILHEKNGEITRYEFKSGIDPKLVQCIFEDSTGTLWFGTSEGLFRHERGKFVVETAKGGLENDSILTLFEDREHNLWLGTNDGLKQLRATVFSSYTTHEGLSHNVVNTVAEDGAGALWIGTMGGGLIRWLEGQRTRYRSDDGLASTRIYALHPAPDGALWVGFEATKYVRIEGDEITSFDGPGVPGSWHGVAITHDSENRILIGTRSGLLRVEGSKVAQVSRGATEEIRALARDRDGAVWIGMENGLARYRDGVVVPLPEAIRLAKVGINALHVDRDGVLWIGTDGRGLLRLHEGKVVACTTQQGLFNDTILEIVEDDAAHLWMTSRQGIFRVAKESFTQFTTGAAPAVECEVFGKRHGLVGVEGSSVAKPAAWKARDGRLWFTTVKGLHVVDPKRLTSNRVPPPVMITSVKANGTPVAPQAVARLPAGRSELEFSYTALSFAQPDRVRFKYRLEGVDSNWVEAGDRRSAHYSGVPPGRRRFEVMAQNNDGVWSAAPAVYRFHLAPRLHQTWWFYGIVGLVAAGAAYGAFQMRVRALRRRGEQLESLVRERTRDLDQEIVERRRIEAALKGSEALYHSLVEILPVNLSRKDTAGRFIFGNAHFCRWLGRPVSEIIGKTEFDFLPHEAAVRSQATDEQAMRTRQPVMGELVEVLADGQNRWWEFLKIAVTELDGKVVGTQGLYWDVTPRKRAEEAVIQAHRDLLETSRKAGMAEVATGVLHNVGNVLNSVNVSATLIAERVRNSRAANIVRLGALLREHEADLAGFLQNDPRGRQVPGFVETLAQTFTAEQAATVEELAGLRKNIEHIKDIVAMQQSYARVSGVAEPIAIVELVEDALGMNASSLTRHEVTLVRDFQAHPTITTEKHKVLQILVNLIRNAKHACDDSGRTDKTITVRVTERDEQIEISVADNGVGIPAENLTRIFGHGFTTRKQGHGFGLHSGALAARELGGSLRAQSEGPGLGAVFTLTLPRNKNVTTASAATSASA